MFFEICKWERRTETAAQDPEIILLDPDLFGFEKPITYQPSRMFEKIASESGSTRFWASWIRIHYSEVWIQIRILLSLTKNSKKNLVLLFCDFLTFYLSKMTHPDPNRIH
jgi:hypothetical protein